ncbi:MAG: cytochrome c oxidase subunit II [Flavobacterium sp.]
MTTLLVLIVVVLLAVALWQLTKIFDLTQIGKNVNDTQIADNNDNKLNGYLMFGFLCFIYLTTIFCLLNYGHFPLIGDSASAHGPEIDNLMVITMVLIFIVQTITQALLHYFAFKYSGKEGQKALYFADSNKLEFIWSIIPAIVLAVLILYGLYAWTNIMFVDEKDEKDAIVIELYAQQFKWEARYSGADDVLGKANVRYIEGVNNLGVDLSDPNAQDDFTSSELHIPKGKRVIFKMRSQDVLHSAYMPHFRAQMNCVPGMVTNFSFIPTVTTAEMREKPAMIEKVAHINDIRAKKSVALVAKGEQALEPYTFDYLLLCNKICGASHYNMQMKIVVDTPEEYAAWLRKIRQKLLFRQLKMQQQKLKQLRSPAQIKDSSATKSKDTTVVAQAETK